MGPAEAGGASEHVVIRGGLEHVVIVASFIRDEVHAERVLSVQAPIMDRFFEPANTARVFVSNNPNTSLVPRLTGLFERNGFYFALNEDVTTYGYELGAWRWAMRHVLPVQYQGTNPEA